MAYIGIQITREIWRFFYHAGRHVARMRVKFGGLHAKFHPIGAGIGYGTPKTVNFTKFGAQM